MARKLTSEQIALIWELKKLPQRDIAARVECSLGMVSKVLAGPEPAKGAVPKPKRAPSPKVDEAIAEAAELVSVDGSDDEAFGECLVRLGVAGELAREAEDVARMVSVERAVASVVQARAKARPEPAEDPNKLPDLVAAAKTVRERWHKLLEGVGDASK